ncbi:MAG: hypothetical protein HOI47_02525 [Candidatus Scalindua sp.]|nr:hypothetical protein [Candidatus Scalindua sp.]
MRIQKKILFTLILTLFAYNLLACADDFYIKTKDGKYIVLHDDGTWEPIEKQETAVKSDSESDFRNVNWGMPKEEVKLIEKAKILQEDENMLIFEEELSGLNVYLQYVFVGRKLVRANYNINENHANSTAHIADYNKLKELLTKKYDTPLDDQIVWKDDQYRDRPQEWGMAISKGDLVLFSVWELWSTSITLYLTGDNYKTIHRIEYKSKKFGDLEDKENEIQAMDDL